MGDETLGVLDCVNKELVHSTCSNGPGLQGAQYSWTQCAHTCPAPLQNDSSEHTNYSGRVSVDLLYLLY